MNALYQLFTQALKAASELEALSHEERDEWCEAVIQRLIVEIDEKLGRQVELVIQHASFKALEALWRNTKALSDKHYPRHQVRIRILDMNWERVSDDLNLSFSLKDSTLYRQIYQQEFNTSGGQPFGLLLIDHEASTEISVTGEHDDLYTLQLLGQLGHEALCPVLMPVAGDFIGTDDADVWCDPERVRRILASDDFIGWRQLRKERVSQFLGLTWPALRVRKPWKSYHSGFVFEEQSSTGSGSSTLWGNSAFALADNILREFCRISWFGFLRGGHDVASGGAVVDLYDDPTAFLRVTPSLENFYSDNGFIPLASGYLTGSVGIYSNRSVFQPDAPLSRKSDETVISMLQTTLLACRIGHYLKIQIRDKIGSYKSASECERELNSWLQTYTSNIEHAEEHILSRYPLKRSMVKVSGDASSGRYHCQISLQPQYQFDFLSSSIVLRTELGSTGAGERTIGRAG